MHFLISQLFRSKWSLPGKFCLSYARCLKTFNPIRLNLDDIHSSSDGLESEGYDTRCFAEQAKEGIVLLGEVISEDEEKHLVQEIDVSDPYNNSDQAILC